MVLLTVENYAYLLELIIYWPNAFSAHVITYLAHQRDYDVNIQTTFQVNFFV